MNHKKSIVLNKIEIYKDYYKSIDGGIDGYYEKTILEADFYEVFDSETLAYFTVHETRGLTSLVVNDKGRKQYNLIFDYVMNLSLFDNVLFSDKDTAFLDCIQKNHYHFEVQAYNFVVGDAKAARRISMRKTESNIKSKVIEEFSDFITYNNLDLEMIESFYYKEKEDVVSFAALEPLVLNPSRYCLSMIVNKKYRGLGYGTKTVQYLINYLQKKGLEGNARCYVKNEISKKTLLRSGLILSNKLLKIENKK